MDYRIKDMAQGQMRQRTKTLVLKTSDNRHMAKAEREMSKGTYFYFAIPSS